MKTILAPGGRRIMKTILAPEGPRTVATGGAMPPRSVGIAEPVVNVPQHLYRPGGAKEALSRGSHHPWISHHHFNVVASAPSVLSVSSVSKFGGGA